MGVKSLDVTNRLFWLGRYSERVYTTLQLFAKRYDQMLDQGDTYGEFCQSLDIPNIYPTAQNFLRRYPFDESDPNSIASNLRRARNSQAPMLEFQKIVDNILAFWGIIDDQVEDENTRNIIKVGKRVERIDLYARLHMPAPALRREVRRLLGRIDRCTVCYHLDRRNQLLQLVEAESLDYWAIVDCVEHLTEV